MKESRIIAELIGGRGHLDGGVAEFRGKAGGGGGGDGWTFMKSE